MAGRLVLQPGSQTPVWDVAGDGSQGFIAAVAVISLVTYPNGRLVKIPDVPTRVWDVAGDGSLGYVEAVALVS